MSGELKEWYKLTYHYIHLIHSLFQLAPNFFISQTFRALTAGLFPVDLVRPHGCMANAGDVEPLLKVFVILRIG